MRRGLADRYIRRPSATILTVTKILEGAAAGYALYVLIRLLILVITATTTLSVGFRQLPHLAIVENGIADVLLGSLSTLLQEPSLPVFISGGIFILVLLVLLFAVLDAVAVLFLRCARKGAGLIRVIHIIWMVSDCIHLTLFICVVINYMIKHNGLLQSVGYLTIRETRIDLYMIYIVAFYLLFLVLRICYHKSVAGVMRTVYYDIRGGARGYFTWPHLSGISFFVGLLYVIYFITFVITLLFDDPAFPGLGRELTNHYLLLQLTVAILLLKQFIVCFCCRNLKRAHQESEMRIPSRVR